MQLMYAAEQVDLHVMFTCNYFLINYQGVYVECLKQSTIPFFNLTVLSVQQPLHPIRKIPKDSLFSLKKSFNFQKDCDLLKL